MKPCAQTVKEVNVMLKTGKYAFGFWNYTSLATHGADRVRDWSDCGMTVTMTPSFDFRTQSDEMLRLLDEAERRQIACIITDHRLTFHSFKMENEAQLRQDFADFLKLFRNHPAYYGVHMGDEPGIGGRQTVENAARLSQILSEMDPEHNHFINLLPCGYSTPNRMGYSGRLITDVYDEFVKASGIKYVCYDCYSQMAEGDAGWNFYFYNLESFRKVSMQNNNIPFWNTIGGCGFDGHHAPTFMDLRWQISTSAAHGAKGVYYFYLYSPNYNPNMEGAPINHYDERTETFNSIAKANREFQDTLGPVMMKLDIADVWHVGRTYGGAKWFEEGVDDLALHVNFSREDGAILSKFRDGEGRLYYALTNNSITKSQNAGITFLGKDIKVFEIGWKGAEQPVRTTNKDGRYDNLDITVVHALLNPGTMRLWRVDPSK